MNFQERFKGKIHVINKQGIETLFTSNGSPIKVLHQNFQKGQKPENFTFYSANSQEDEKTTSPQPLKNTSPSFKFPTNLIKLESIDPPWPIPTTFSPLPQFQLTNLGNADHMTRRKRLLSEASQRRDATSFQRTGVTLRPRNKTDFKNSLHHSHNYEGGISASIELQKAQSIIEEAGMTYRRPTYRKQNSIEPSNQHATHMSMMNPISDPGQAQVTRRSHELAPLSINRRHRRPANSPGKIVNPRKNVSFDFENNTKLLDVTINESEKDSSNSRDVTHLNKKFNFVTNNPILPPMMTPKRPDNNGKQRPVEGQIRLSYREEAQDKERMLNGNVPHSASPTKIQVDERPESSSPESLRFKSRNKLMISEAMRVFNGRYSSLK